MQHYYDGQIRRYVTQTIRVFSNFVVKYGDGSLHRIPVMYGDADRQVANIIKNNSENKVNSVPRIAVYITGLEMDRDRLSDSTYVGKLHFRERDTVNGAYTQSQGRNYTVERLMPTPYKLTMKVDIWTANTDQKLQVMEQLLVLFNPSLELQTTDNYIDWTSLTVLNIDSITWSNRTVPVGNDTPIDIGTIALTTPIWISPPVKVKHLGVITKIITNVWANSTKTLPGYIDGLGTDPAGNDPTVTFSDLIATDTVTIGGYSILVYNGNVTLLSTGEAVLPIEPTKDVTVAQGSPENWSAFFDEYPGKFVAGSSQIFLSQPNGTAIIGTIAINPLDPKILTVNWNPDTLITNTGIDSNGFLDTDIQHYSPQTSHRANSPGTFDAIINPLTFNPGTVAAGTRYLIIEDIGNADNAVPAAAWGSLVAFANDIIEWTGSDWNVIFNSNQEHDTMLWQTNIYTGVQYLWNGISWVKSFEGEYGPAQWKIVL